MWMGWFSPDLYLGMGALGACIYVFFASLPTPQSAKPMFTAGVVQPYIPPSLKWDTERELQNLEILEKQTRFVASIESDLVLWPEAATPWPIVGSPQMQARVERLVNEIGKPILMGNLGEDHESEEWVNGTFLVEPGSGLSPQSYAKRELVPFGEYVPAPFGFLDKVVPLGGSFVPGESVGLIQMQIGETRFKVGSLVCYEDVFPGLARKSARAGADVFFVATNNAWYGEEGAPSSMRLTPSCARWRTVARSCELATAAGAGGSTAMAPFAMYSWMPMVVSISAVAAPTRFLNSKNGSASRATIRATATGLSPFRP